MYMYGLVKHIFDTLAFSDTCGLENLTVKMLKLSITRAQIYNVPERMLYIRPKQLIIVKVFHVMSQKTFCHIIIRCSLQY